MDCFILRTAYHSTSTMKCFLAPLSTGLQSPGGPRPRHHIFLRPSNGLTEYPDCNPGVLPEQCTTGNAGEAMTADSHVSPVAVPPTAEDGRATLLRWLRQMRDEHPVLARRVWGLACVSLRRRGAGDLHPAGVLPPIRIGWSRPSSASARPTCLRPTRHATTCHEFAHGGCGCPGLPKWASREIAPAMDGTNTQLNRTHD